MPPPLFLSLSLHPQLTLALLMLLNRENWVIENIEQSKHWVETFIGSL